MSLATVEQLRLFIQNPDLDEDVATQALATATSYLQMIAGQQFEFVSQETVLLVGGRRMLPLPQGPLIMNGDEPLAVSEVSVPGVPGAELAEGVGYVRVGSQLLRMSGGGGLAPLRARYPVWAPWVEVTYSHGYLTAPGWLTDIVLGAAAVLAAPPAVEGQVESRTVGGMSETYAVSSTDSGSAPWMDLIRAKLIAVGLLADGAFTIEPV